MDIELMQRRKKKPRNIESKGKSEYKYLEVERASNIAEDLINHIDNCKSMNVVSNVAVDGVMEIGKSYLMKVLQAHYMYTRKDLAVIVVLPFNSISDTLLQDNKVEYCGEIKTLRYQKCYGQKNDKVKPNFKTLESKLLVTNYNNLEKTINLVRKHKLKIMIHHDEAHVSKTDYIFRNQNENSDYKENALIMKKFNEIVNNALSYNKTSDIESIIWLSATMEVYENDKMKFTKYYDLNVPEKNKRYIDLLELLTVNKMGKEECLQVVIKALEERNGTDFIYTYINNSEIIDYVVEGVKNEYKRNPNLLQNINSIEGVYKNNAEESKVLEIIKREKRVPDDFDMLITTSYLNAGIEIIMKNRISQSLVFLDPKTYAKCSEIQSTRRIRGKQRKITLVKLADKNTAPNYEITYKRYFNREKSRLTASAQALKVFLDTTVSNQKDCDIQKFIKNTFNLNSNDNVVKCILYDGGQFIVSEDAIENMVYNNYQQKERLPYSNRIIDDFFNHKSLNFIDVAKPRAFELKEVAKEKKEKVTKEDTQLINNNIIKIKKDLTSLIWSRNESGRVVTNKKVLSLVKSILMKDNISDINLDISTNKEIYENVIFLMENDKLYKILSVYMHIKYPPSDAIIKKYLDDESVKDKIVKAVQKEVGKYYGSIYEGFSTEQERYDYFENIRYTLKDMYTYYCNRKNLDELSKDYKAIKNKRLNSKEKYTLYNALANKGIIKKQKENVKDVAGNVVSIEKDYEDNEQQKRALANALSVSCTLKGKPTDLIISTVY